MSAQKLRCSCGYSWTHSFSGPVPKDLRQICPVCTSNGDQPTLDQPYGGLPTNTGAPLEFPAGKIELQRGTQIAGFEVLEELNRGGMGVIYKARQLGLNRVVALKFIIPDRIGRLDAMKRFQREVQAAALLSHPNIVTVFHTDLSGSWPYLAMEFVPGIDLFRLVKTAGTLSFADSCLYIQQAAYGLQHAYERGLVHRDIKPHNLMVTPSPLDPPPANAPRRQPTVKILDMGLARVQAVGEHAGSEGLTQAGEFLGTPDYISPEQAEDPRLADTRSDLYSLGATWFFLLTGDVPFPGANLMQKLRRQLTQPVPRVTERRPDTPPGLTAIIRKLMEKDAALRFQTPAELDEAIAEQLRQPGQTSTAPAAASKPAAAPAAPSQSGPLKVMAHDRGVQAICLSSDGQTLVTGGDDETLRVWEAARVRELHAVSADIGPVRGLAIVPSGKWAASCALRLFEDDMVVQLWDLGSGAERRRLKGPTKNVICVSVAADGRKVAAGSEDRTIRLWSLDQPNSPALTLKGHTDTVTTVLFLPDGATLLSVSLDGTMRQWDVKTGQSRGGSQPQAGPLRGAAFGGASKRMALVGDLLRLRQENGTLMTLPGHRGQPLCVAFSADGSLLASGGLDNTVRLWRTADGNEVTCFEGHEGAVRSVVFSPDGRFLYSGSSDGTLRRWMVPAAT